MATKVGRIDFIFLIPPFTWPLNPLLTFLAYFLAYFYTVSQIIAFSFVNSETSTSYEELQTVWNNFGWSFLKAEVTTQCQTARQRTTRFVRNVNLIWSGVRTWLGVCDVDPAAPTVRWTVRVLETLPRGVSTIIDVPESMKQALCLNWRSLVSDLNRIVFMFRGLFIVGSGCVVWQYCRG